MRNELQIALNIAELHNLYDLIETYQVIAASTVRRIRDSVLQNRYFHQGLERIFRAVRRIYKKEFGDRVRNSHPAKLSRFMPRGRKIAYVFLSANTGLYGDIVSRVFSFFAEALERKPHEIIVVGKIGRAMFEKSFPASSFKYFDFPDHQIDSEALKAIARYLSQFASVVIHYGSFKNLFSQNPTSTDVTGELSARDEDGHILVKYLFEPSLEEVALFFEREIFGALLEQTFNESRLAKVASRVALLDGATTNIEQALDDLTLQKKKMWHRRLSKIQIDSMRATLLVDYHMV